MTTLWDQMVEAGARAIIEGRAATGDDLGRPLSGKKLSYYVDNHWSWWQSDAENCLLAALAKLAEVGPSDTMIVDAAMILAHNYASDLVITKGLRTMIRALLAEGEGKEGAIETTKREEQ